ncbi:aldo/keto reductase [Hyphococcus luteus]|uniref:Oxidoreductase n=1 Tax=Hyphococcus luteus TaxID=2058213 RepID=A0A2S7K5D8_9PROT|nr:aldo/keto reductase [Marinicaulis flavus]PQA87686.1 oxidoreductase [Marinicaulis flavus]
MRYKLLGRTGLRVSEAALGTATFGTAWGWGAEEKEARKIFNRYAEAGGNFLDCADGYQNSESESLIGGFLETDRDHFVVSTKYGGGPGRTHSVSKTGASRKNMLRSLEKSLRRLRTDRVDIFQVHFDDGVTPVEEILRGFEDVVSAGKALYAGFSNFPAWRIARAATLAEATHGPSVACIQAEYSLAERSIERELLPMAEGLEIGVMAWAALGGGLLSGKYRKQENADSRMSKGGGRVLKEAGPRETAILDAVEAVAKETGASAAQVALGWVRAQNAKRKASIIPIIGARTLEQLEENLAAFAMTLDETHVQRLDAASAIVLGYPHDWLASDLVRNLGSAGHADEIDEPGYPVA